MSEPAFPRRASTLEGVATEAGVSRATVSRVVNGGIRVSPVTQRAVERAIQRLGYTPNRAARALVTRRTDSVGLVIPEPTSHIFGDPFFSRLVRGIAEILATGDLQLVLLTPQSKADEERLARYLTGGHLDGVLLVSLHGQDALPGFLQSRGIPVVVGGRPPDGVEVSFVDVDNVDGARSAVRHLIRGGRRRIATLTGPLDMAVAADRLEGYRAALAEAGIPLDHGLELSGEFDQERAHDRTRELLRRHPDVDAIFAASDPMAAGALQALRRADRSVPTDVAMVSFDDSGLASSAEPPMTSVRQPIEEMGREMARLLTRMVTSRDRVARRVILATELVVRGSSGG
ncbi:MAG: LacI family DNA-binding transcriptional regulator [Candidatus Limnocylindria bacterium]